MQLDDSNTMRYCRHILLPQVQEDGQEKLMNSHVLVVGAGGLGCAVLPYLAASGVGKISLFDADDVDITNLQRQILHTEQSLGESKVDSAELALTQINQHIQINTYSRHFSQHDKTILQTAHVVVDCSDNLDTRLLLNELCWQQAIPLISGSAIRMEGQFIHFPMRKDDPCYACVASLFNEPSLSCMEAGVLSPVVGTIGTLQATEALKSLLNMPPNDITLTLYDAQACTFQAFKIPKYKQCPVCQSR